MIHIPKPQPLLTCQEGPREAHNKTSLSGAMPRGSRNRCHRNSRPRRITSGATHCGSNHSRPPEVPHNCGHRHSRLRAGDQQLPLQPPPLPRPLSPPALSFVLLRRLQTTPTLKKQAKFGGKFTA